MVKRWRRRAEALIQVEACADQPIGIHVEPVPQPSAAEAPIIIALVPIVPLTHRATTDGVLIVGKVCRGVVAVPERRPKIEGGHRAVGPSVHGKPTLVLPSRERAQVEQGGTKGRVLECATLKGRRSKQPAPPKAGACAFEASASHLIMSCGNWGRLHQPHLHRSDPWRRRHLRVDHQAVAPVTPGICGARRAHVHLVACHADARAIRIKLVQVEALVSEAEALWRCGWRSRRRRWRWWRQRRRWRQRGRWRR